MKKTTIALAVAGLVATVATVVQAAPQANTFYVGAKAGWASVRHGLNQYQYRDESDGAVIGKAKINSEAYGVSVVIKLPIISPLKRVMNFLVVEK